MLSSLNSFNLHKGQRTCTGIKDVLTVANFMLKGIPAKRKASFSISFKSRAPASTPLHGKGHWLCNMEEPRAASSLPQSPAPTELL